MRFLLGVDPAIAEIRLAACLSARHVLQHSAACPWSATRPMPELPEVETVRRGLAMRMEGRRIAALVLNRADLRTSLPVGLRARVEGRRVTHLGRRAKYILVHLDDRGVLIAHLGMSGRIVGSEPGSREPPDPHDPLVFTLRGRTALRFHAARPSPVDGSATTNSWPPQRAATSQLRTATISSRPTAASTASPAACPRVSLMFLK